MTLSLSAKPAIQITQDLLTTRSPTHAAAVAHPATGGSESEISIADASIAVSSRAAPALKDALRPPAGVTVSSCMLPHGHPVDVQKAPPGGYPETPTQKPSWLDSYRRESLRIDYDAHVEVEKIIQRALRERQPWTGIPEIDLIKASYNTVFRLKSTPKYVFKLTLANDAEMWNRTDNMRRAQEIITQNRLDLLYVPRWYLFHVHASYETDSTFVLAEESVDIDPHLEAQEELYRRCDRDLGPTFQQLACFAAAMNWDDVRWSNIPLIGVRATDDTATFRPPYQIALIDLEHAGGKRLILRAPGLFSCSTERHFATIENEFRKAGWADEQLWQEEKAKRLDELRKDAKLFDYFERTGCLADPDKRVPKLTPTDLGLPVSPSGCASCLRFQGVIDEVTRAINAQLDAKASLPRLMLKQRRDVCLDTNNNALSRYHRNEEAFNSKIPIEEYEKRWVITRVLDAMQSKDLLFETYQKNGYGYFIRV